jgi:hypothetical protein
MTFLINRQMGNRKTVIVITQRQDNGTMMYTTDLIGDKPSDQMSKNGIEELLKYVYKVHRLE